MQKPLMLPLKLSQTNLSNQNNQSKVEIVSLLFALKRIGKNLPNCQNYEKIGTVKKWRECNERRHQD